MNKEMKELNQYREWMYRFLASVFIQEIDEAMLASMQKMTFPAFPETNTPWQQDLNAGFRLMESYLAGFEGKSEEEVHAKKKSMPCWKIWQLIMRKSFWQPVMLQEKQLFLMNPSIPVLTALSEAACR